MVDASPITGRPRTEQFKDLAVCLADLLKELPDTDDIEATLNVAVKLDRILAFLDAFPTPAELRSVITGLNEVKALLAQNRTDIIDALAANQAEVRMAVNTVAGIRGDVGALMRIMTTERKETVAYIHEFFRNEEWLPIAGPMPDATTEAVIQMGRALEPLRVEFGVSANGRGDADAVLSDQMTVSSSPVAHELAYRIAKGSYLMMRAVSTTYGPHYFDAANSNRLRVRVNTIRTKWGGHVYCHAQQPSGLTNPDPVTMEWQYRYSSNSWAPISGRADAHDFAGHDSDWLCLPPQAPPDSPPSARDDRTPNAFRCKVSQPRPGTTDLVTYSPVVYLTDQHMPVASTIFS